MPLNPFTRGDFLRIGDLSERGDFLRIGDLPRRGDLGLDEGGPVCYSRPMPFSLPAPTVQEQAAVVNGEADYASLTPMQQKWVDAMLETGGRSPKEAARIAGFSNGNGNGWAVTGYKLARDPKILAVLRQEADVRVRSGAVLGASVLIDIANDPLHKDRFKAAVELLNRAGLLVTKEVKIDVTHREEPEAERVARIVQMAKNMGLDPRSLLGQAGVDYIDAEFEDKTDDPLQLSASDDDDPWTIRPGET